MARLLGLMQSRTKRLPGLDDPAVTLFSNSMGSTRPGKMGESPLAGHDIGPGTQSFPPDECVCYL